MNNKNKQLKKRFKNINKTKTNAANAFENQPVSQKIISSEGRYNISRLI